MTNFTTGLSTMEAKKRAQPVRKKTTKKGSSKILKLKKKIRKKSKGLARY
jgi:hypothetical protein